MAEPIIDLLASTFGSISEVGRSLSDADWNAPTDCPGWSAKDVVGHLIGIEGKLLGLPDDPALGDYPAYVKNDIGRFGENAVAARRDRSGADVLAEFDGIVGRRLDALRRMTDADFDKIGWSPIGEVPYRQFMTVRLFDSWTHEQDIRRAVGRPGHLAGPDVDAVLAWHRRSLGYIVGKKAKAPDGSVVAFDVTGPAVTHEVVEVAGGRAAVVDQPSHAPDAVLHLDTETYAALLCGRWDGATAIANGRVGIEGDTALGTTVAQSMAYVI